MPDTEKVRIFVAFEKQESAVKGDDKVLLLHKSQRVLLQSPRVTAVELCQFFFSNVCIYQIVPAS